MINNYVVCFGEVLWDNLPSGRVPGGAPLNVAYHLKKLEVEASIISSVGNDNFGRELLEAIEEKGLSTEFCLISEKYPTSTVNINFSNNNEVNYDIVSPVAWDALEWRNDFYNLVEKSNAFVYGSLSGRSQVSR